MIAENNKYSLRPAYQSTSRCFVYAALLLFFLSLIARGINFFNDEYPGNNYFPPNTIDILFTIILIYGGCVIQFGHHSWIVSRLMDILIFLLVLLTIAFATNSVQFTPFPTIDQAIINIERSFHIDLNAMISWTNHQPLCLKILAFTYDTLSYQMTYIPLLLIMAKRHNELHEYYFLLLFSTILGFTFYYFFPTTAPASLLESPYFMTSQQATGLKFLQIHQHIPPTTLDGGLIALPSFHVIWAWLCLYSLRIWPILFFILLPINLLLVASCVLLGWHYPMDILGGLIVILLSHIAYHRLSALLILINTNKPQEALSTPFYNPQRCPDANKSK